VVGIPFTVVLDASVLYPLPLRDTLLPIAETELCVRSGVRAFDVARVCA
jgi:hypothetical protein